MEDVSMREEDFSYGRFAYHGRVVIFQYSGQGAVYWHGGLVYAGEDRVGGQVADTA